MSYDADKLIRLGDSLYEIDQVQEYNEMGFNKIDWGCWPSARGNPLRMARILKKYKRQLTQYHGEQAFIASGLAEPLPTPETAYVELVEGKPGTNLIVSNLVATKRMEHERFMKYVAAHKNAGFRFNGQDRTWVFDSPIPPSTVHTLLAALEEIDVDLTVSIPEKMIGERLDNAPAVKTPASKTIRVGQKDDGRFAISFPFHDGLNKLVNNKAGNISGIMEYNPQTHARETFDIELVDEVLEKMKGIVDWPIQEEPEIEQARKAHRKWLDDLREPIPQVQSIIANGFSLFPYQNHGYRKLDETDGNLLIGDEMGLGKTLQTLAWIAAKKKRAVIVCPKTVRRNWINEAHKFFPDYFNGMELTPKTINQYVIKDGLVDPLEGFNIVTVNFENVSKVVRRIAGFDTLVIDESHYIKNPKASRTKTILNIARNFKHHILLSGTAIKNRREELFTQLDIVQPGKFKDKGELLQTTIGGLWNDIQNCYLARTKDRVMPDLPDKISTIIEMEFKGLPTEDFRDIGDIARIKDQLAQAKVPGTVDFIKELLESSDSKIVVFTDSVQAAKDIHEALGKGSILHHGQMTDDAREDAKDRFQKEILLRVFVTTRQSCAVGVNLDAADKVVFNDLPWTPADVRQAEDRAHRVTSKNTVNSYWITASNHALDFHIADIIRRKYDLTKRVNEGRQVSPEEREWLDKAISPADLRKAISADRRKSA